MIDTRIRLSALPSTPHLFTISTYLPYGDPPLVIRHLWVMTSSKVSKNKSHVLSSYSASRASLPVLKNKMQNLEIVSFYHEIKLTTIFREAKDQNCSICLYKTLQSSQSNVWEISKRYIFMLVQEPPIHLEQIMSWFHPGENNCSVSDAYHENIANVTAEYVKQSS